MSTNLLGFAQTSTATLVDLLRERALRHPDRRAYTFLVDGESEEQHLTYGELDRQARAIAAQLQGLGMTGERALLLYPPGLEYIAGFFGCLYAGTIAVPAYPPNPLDSTYAPAPPGDDRKCRRHGGADHPDDPIAGRRQRSSRRRI